MPVAAAAAARDSDIPKQELLRTMARGMDAGVVASLKDGLSPLQRKRPEKAQREPHPTMMKGKTVQLVNLASGTPSSPRVSIGNATRKEERKSPSKVSPKETAAHDKHQEMTPRSRFPVTCSLIIDSASQSLLTAEGLQALGRSVTAISACLTYAAALSTAEQQLRTLMMHSVLLVSSRSTPHVVSCLLREGVAECAASSRVYRACDRVDAFGVVGGEAVALQCCSAERNPAHQAFSAVVVLKHFGSIHAKELKWKPAGCEVAILEAFLVQVAPLLHFMRLADSKIVSPAILGSTAPIDAQAQEQSAAAPAIKPKQRRSDQASSPHTPNVGADETQSHPRAQAPDVKSHSAHPEISLLQAALAAMGDLMMHCHGAFVPYDPVLRCFVLDPQLLVLPGNNRPSFTPKFIEDSRLNMRKQLLPADMYPFSEPMLQRQLLYVPDAAHEASIQRALSDVHAGSTVSSQNIIISSMFQSLYGCGSLIACAFWDEEHSSEIKGVSTDAGYRGTFVLWAERQRMIPQHLCAAIDNVCHRFSETIFHSRKQSAQAMHDTISSSVASAAVSLASLRTSLNKRLVHIAQELLPRIFSSANRNSMLDTTYAFAVWIPTPQFSIDGFNEISELHLVASTVDGRLIQERMDRQKLENYPVLLQAWLRGGIVCIDGRGCYGCPDAVATIHRTRELFGVPPELLLCETAIATSQQTGTDCVLAAVQIIGCQRAQGYTESELTALAQVAQMLGGFVLQEQENVLKQQTQLKTNATVSNLSSLLSATSLALGKVTFDAFNFCDIENLSLCEQNILKSFPLRSVRSQLKCMLAQVNARSAAFILVDVTESSVVLVLQVTAGAAFCSSDRQPKQCLLESRTGLVYRCIKTRKPVVYNLESIEPLDARVDCLARDKFTTCLLVPIVLENRVVAVVQVFSKLPSDSFRQGKVPIIETDAAKAVAPEVLSAAFQRSRAHMHMLRSGRADLMALERLPVLEALSSSEVGGAISPNWRSEQGAPDFGAEDIEIATAASEACGQMVSLAFRAGHCVKVASNMSRFAHLIQIEDSGETLSKYACKVIVELLTASISPRLSCACFVFLLRTASKTVDSSLIETGSFCEGEELQSSLTATDVEIAKHVITKQMSDGSIVVCCPIHDGLVGSENSDESEAMGVMAVQMPESYQRMSEAEVDAMKVVCQHLAEALNNSSALICTAKERANRQQHAAIDFLGNCIGCDNVDSMMMSVCKELNAFMHFDSVAAFTVKARNSNSSSALSIDHEWTVSHFSDDSNRLSAQPGILRVLGTEVLTSASSIGPLVVDGLESAGNMFGHFQLARAVASTKVSIRPARLKKTLSGAPLCGCVFGIPISCLQDDGSLNLCGSVVFARDSHDNLFEHNDVQLIQALMFKLAKVLVKLQQGT